MGCITFLKRPDGSEIEIDLNNILAPSQIEMMRESYNDRIDGLLDPMSPSEFVEAVKSGKIDLGKIFRVENTEEQQPSSSVEEQIAELEREREQRILEEQEVSRINYIGTDGTIRQVRTYGDGSRKTFAIDEDSNLATELTKVSKQESITNEEAVSQMLDDEFTTEALPIKEGKRKAIDKEYDSKIAELKSQQQPSSSDESIPESTYEDHTETPDSNFTPTKEDLNNSNTSKGTGTKVKPTIGNVNFDVFSTNTGSRKKASLKEETKRAKRIFKDIEVGYRERIFTPSGELAEGFYNNAIVLSEQDAGEGTAYHEAFHAFMDVVVDQETKDKLIQEALKDPDSGYYENAEEFLSEEFRDYSLTREKRKGLIGKVFDVLDRILGLFNKRRKVFDKLYRGGYKYYPKSEAGKVEFSKIQGLTGEQKREAVRGVARMVLSNSQALIKGSKGKIKPSDYNYVLDLLKANRDQLVYLNDRQYDEAIKNYEILLSENNFKIIVQEANMMLSDLGAKETKDDIDPNDEEFENSEDIDKEVDGEVFGVNAMNFDQSAKASGFLKALIATLPDASNVNGEIVKSESSNFPGMPIISDRSQNWKILKKEMNGTVSKQPGVIARKLKELGNTYPQLAELGRMMDSDKISNHHKVALESLLSGQKIEYSTTVVAGGTVTHVNSDITTADKQAKERLNNSIEALLSNKPSVAQTAAKIFNKLREIRTVKDGNILIEDIAPYVEGMKMIGFPLSKSELSGYMTDAKSFNEAWQEMKNFANQVSFGLNEDGELKGDPFREIKKLKQTLSAKENIQAERMVKGEDNKSYFTEAQNHFASKQLGLFKSKERSSDSDLTEGQRAIEDLLSTEYHKASLALKQLSKDPDSISMEAFLVRTTNGDTGKSGGNLSLIDDLSDRINRVITNIHGGSAAVVPITQADKSMTYMLKGLPIQKMANQGVANDTAVNLFSDYAFAELDRIVAHLNRSSKKGIKVYDKKKNAQKSTWFPRLSFGKEFSDQLFVMNEDTGLYEVSDNATSIIRDVVKEDLASAIAKSFKKANKIGIIERNEKGLPSFKGVDKGLQENYLKGNYELGIQDMYADFVLNSMMANIEYTMLFTGDPAFYKDLDKRVPATIATGIDLVPQEGTDRKNPDGTITKNGKFKVAVLEDFEGDPNDDNNRAHSSFVKKGKAKGAYEIYFDNKKLNHFNLDKGLLAPYFKNNKADAQGYITPQRLMDLFRGMGKVSDEIIEAFDRLTKDEYGDNYPQMTADMETIYKKMNGQPLKGMYFGLHKDGDVSRPVYLKYSQAVLWPGLVKGTRLEKLQKQMYEQGVDEAIFESGVKVGAQGLNDVSNSLEGDSEIQKLTTFDLDNFNWKLQQDLPTGKEVMQRASQAPRNIIANLNSKSEDLKDLAQDFQDIEIEISKRGATDLAMDFSADRYGNTDISSIAKKLKEDAIKKEKDSNLISMLERVETIGDITFDDIPGISSLIESELLSTVTKRTVKQKIKGSSYIQLSNMGFQPMSELSNDSVTSQETIWFKDKKELRGPRMSDDNKTVIPGDILLPYNVIKDLPSEIRAQIREGKLTGKQIEKYLGDTINNLVGFRIPNQAMSSNDVLNIAGILPPHAGDTVVTYTEVTGKTGADFDIDKMYIMTPHVSFNKKKNKLETIKPNLKENVDSYKSRYETRKQEIYTSSKEYKDLRGKYLNSIAPLNKELKKYKNILEDTTAPEAGKPETDKKRMLAISKIDEINDALLPFKEEFKMKSDVLMDEITGKYFMSFEKFSSLPIMQQQSQKALENMRLSKQAEIIGHRDSFIELITPLDNDDLRDDAKYLAILEEMSKDPNGENGIFDKEAFEEVIGSKEDLSPANAQKYFEAKTKPALDFADPMTQLEIKAKNAAGKMGVAITADQLSSISLFQLAKVSMTTESNFYKRDVDKHGTLDLSKELDSSDTLITLNLSAYLNAYVDNAKDPYISLVNNNKFTSSVGYLMLRSGLTMQQVNRFLSQPILKDYVEFMENDESPLSDFRTKESDGESKYSIPVYKNGVMKPVNKNGNKNALARTIEKYRGSLETKNMIKGRPSAKGLEINSLEDNIKNANRSERGQLEILNEFLALEEQAKSLVSMVKMTSVSSKGAYRSLGERMKAKASMNAILSENNDRIQNAHDLLFAEGKPTLVGQHSGVTNEWTDNLLTGVLEGFGENNRDTIYTFFNRISKTVDAGHVNRMTNFINSALRANNEAYAVEDSNTLFKGKNSVGNQVKFLKKSGLVEDNDFLNSLYVDKPVNFGGITEGVATFVKFGQGGKDMNSDAIEKLVDDWRDLLNDDRKFTTKGGREFVVSDIAKDLIKYAFHSSLGQKSFSSFYHLIPSENIINGKKEVNDTKKERQRLADLYAIHNKDDFFTKVSLKGLRADGAPKGEVHLNMNKKFMDNSDLVSEDKINPYIKVMSKDNFGESIENLYIFAESNGIVAKYLKVDKKMTTLKEEGRGSRHDVTANYTTVDAWTDYDVKSTGDLLFEDVIDNFEDSHDIEYVSKGDGWDILVDGVPVAKPSEFFKNKSEALNAAKIIYEETNGSSRKDKIC